MIATQQLSVTLTATPGISIEVAVTSIEVSVTSIDVTLTLIYLNNTLFVYPILFL